MCCPRAVLPRSEGWPDQTDATSRPTYLYPIVTVARCSTRSAFSTRPPSPMARPMDFPAPTYTLFRQPATLLPRCFGGFHPRAVFGGSQVRRSTRPSTFLTFLTFRPFRPLAFDPLTFAIAQTHLVVYAPLVLAFGAGSLCSGLLPSTKGPLSRVRAPTGAPSEAGCALLLAFVFDLSGSTPVLRACASVWPCLTRHARQPAPLLAPRLVCAPDAPCWRVPVSS